MPAREGGSKGGRERESEADSPLSVEPNAGLDLGTLRSGPDTWEESATSDLRVGDLSPTLCVEIIKKKRDAWVAQSLSICFQLKS